MKTICVSIFFLTLSLFGCATLTEDQQKSVFQLGATGIGAAVGQMVGKDTKSTLIGAGIGFATGGLLKEWVTFPTHNAAAVAAVRQGGTVSYQVDDVPGSYYTARVIGSQGSCHWVEETEWRNGQKTNQWRKRVCKGDTPWNPSEAPTQP